MEIIIQKNPFQLDYTFDEVDLYIERDGVGIYFKGFFFVGDKYYDGSNAARLILEDYLRHNYITEPNKFNGCHLSAIIDKKSQKVLIFTDRLGTHLLYYLAENEVLYISRNFWNLFKRSRKKFDKLSVIEMMRYGFVTNEYTLIENIHTFLNHSIYVCDNSLNMTRKSYWEYIPDRYESDNGLNYKFRDVLNKVFARWKYIWNQEKENVVLMLTGGLDSRLIAFYMSQENYPYKTISYGSEDNYDWKVAKIIAEKLGFTQLHHKIETYYGYVLGDLYEELCKKVGMITNYFRPAGTYVISQIAKSDQYLISGLCNDIFTGGNIKPKFITDKYQPVRDYILNNKGKSMPHGAFLYILRDNMKEYFYGVEDRLTEYLKDKMDTSGYIKVHCWLFDNYSRKLSLSEFHCLNDKVLLMPFFDYEYIDFLKSIPPSYLLNQRLFINTLFFDIYVGRYNVLKQIPRANARYLHKIVPRYSGLLSVRNIISDLELAYLYYRYRLKYDKRFYNYEYFWLYDESYRQITSKMVLSAEHIEEFFDKSKLSKYLTSNKDYLFASGGIFSLLTIAFNKWAD